MSVNCSENPLYRRQKVTVLEKTLYNPENLGYNTDPKICGSSSVVEHDLAKVGVAGSTPVSRSIILNPDNL